MPIPIITTLGQQTLAQMLTHAQEQNVRARQDDAARRLLILQENWRHVVWQYINGIYKTDSVRVAMSKRVRRTFNVLQQLCRRVCVSYRVPPLRRLEGAPTATEKAYQDLLLESRIVTRAKDWERYAFSLNVVIVVPVVRDDLNGKSKRLDYEMILPHCAEVHMDPSDPMGTPTAVCFTAKNGSDYSGKPLRTVTLDAQAWRYYDDHDRPIGMVEHGAGVFPGVVWRLDNPVDDWWSSHRGSGVVDATIAVAHLAARMDWVRDAQDRKKEIAKSSSLSKIPGQVASPEGALEVPLDPEDFDYEAIDVNTPITNHLEHIRAYLHQAAESIGVPSVLVDFDVGATNYGNVTPLASAQQVAALDEVRTSHIEFYREAERDLAWKTALVLRGMGHPSASKLQPDYVYDRFRIGYPDLTYNEDPLARATVAEKRIAIGLSSTYNEYHQLHPEMTPDQVRKQVNQFALDEGELNAFYIEHNIPRDPAERRKTLAQLQGEQGGKASGEVRAADSENDDDESSEPGRAADSSDYDTSER